MTAESTTPHRGRSTADKYSVVSRWEETIDVGPGEWLAVSAAGRPNSRGAVVLVHGLGGDRRGPADLFTDLADAALLADRAAVRFDLRGAGESSGELRTSSLSGMVDDAVRVAAWARERWPDGPVTLAGHSIGGVVCALAATTPESAPDDVVCLSCDLDTYDYGIDDPVLFARDTEFFPAEFAAERAVLILLGAGFCCPISYVSGTDEREGILASAAGLDRRGIPVHRIEGADHLFTAARGELQQIMAAVFADSRRRHATAAAAFGAGQNGTI